MTWPTTATKVNLDASGDDPKLARAELVSLIDKFNQLQAHVTAFAQGLLDDATAGTALTTLGISAFIQTLLDDAAASNARTTLAAAGTGVANTFTATQTWSKGADVASANALTLGADGNYFDITGTTAITSIGTKGIGTVVKLHFDAALTLTHHATDLILPGGASITTAAGDEAEFIEYASADWRCTKYQKASGLPVVAGSAGKIAQIVESTTSADFSITATITVDATIPQITEGTEILTRTVTPTNANSTFLVEAEVQAAHSSVAAPMVFAMFTDAVANAFVAVEDNTGNTSVPVSVCFSHILPAFGDVSLHTIRLRGAVASGTMYVNRHATTANVFDTAMITRLRVTEILP